MTERDDHDDRDDRDDRVTRPYRDKWYCPWTGRKHDRDDGVTGLCRDKWYCPWTGRKDDDGDVVAADREVEADVLQVLDALRGDVDTPPLPATLVQTFEVLQRLRSWMRWDDGLRDGLVDVLLGAVRQAERFGDGTGKFKRRFATDVVIRTIENDTFGSELPSAFHDALVPFVGVLLDLTVAMVNYRGAWTPVARVRLPLFFHGRGGYARLARFGVWLWAGWLAIRRILVAPTKYERNVRDSVKRLAPERNALAEILPRDRAITIVEEVATAFAKIGEMLAPQAKLLDALYRLAGDIAESDAERRSEVVLIALRVVLKETYADRPFAAALIDSPIGEFVLGEAVRAMGRLFKRLEEPRRALRPLLTTGAAA